MTKKTRSIFTPTAKAVSALSLIALLGAGCTDENPASDVRGNYDLAYDDVLTFKLKVGGQTYSTEGRDDENITFDTQSGPLVLDLGQFCGREDIQCPSETLWNKVSVNQPNIEAANPNTHVVNFVNNTERDLPEGQRAQVVSGLIDERDRFGLILGGGNESEGDCSLLAISTSGGRFSHEGERVETIEDDIPDGGIDAGTSVDGGGIRGAPRTRIVWDEGAPVDGIKEGKVKLGFLATCAFEGLVVGATLEIETGYTGTRTGDFDPPPFDPLDPEDVEPGLTVPDGGVIDADAGPVFADAGPNTNDGGSASADAGPGQSDGGTAP